MRNSNQLRNGRRRQFFSNAEIKFMVLSFVTLFCGTLILSVFSYTTATADGYIRSIVDYSACQLFGKNDSCQFVPPYDPATRAAFATINKSCLGLVTWVNLVFPIAPGDFKKIKSVMARAWKKIRRSVLVPL